MYEIEATVTLATPTELKLKARLHKSRTEIGYATEAIPFSGQIDTGNLNYSNALFVDVATLSK
jgi:hypothetical protein